MNFIQITKYTLKIISLPSDIVKTSSRYLSLIVHEFRIYFISPHSINKLQSIVKLQIAQIDSGMKIYLCRYVEGELLESNSFGSDRVNVFLCKVSFKIDPSIGRLSPFSRNSSFVCNNFTPLLSHECQRLLDSFFPLLLDMSIDLK